MTQQQIEKRRKWFFIGISLLATAITLASFGATYSINMKSLAAALLGGSVLVMAMNYIVHHKTITGAPLTGWQVDYIQWAGPLSIFGILLLIVGIVVFNHDARERRLEREVAFAARRKALEWEQSQLESRALEEHMAQYQPQVFEKVRRALTLPSQYTLPTNAPSTKQIGFGERNEAGEFPNEPGR
jgi:hypothetical protein